MPSNFVIGIGGTGARCVESFLHLCAAGLGPNSVSVGLIDQDENNGNVNRTSTLARLLQKLRAGLRQGGVHKLAPNSPLFSSEINFIGDGGFWCPLSGADKSISDGFDIARMGEVRPLFESLFSAEERRMTLNEGYRARPSIGAAVLAGNALGEDAFWKALANDLKQGTGGLGGARLFIFGSLFGGTGAAGFPTIARVLRAHPDMHGITGVQLGGALMLPYFQFGDPTVDDGRTRARSSEFASQAENALRYYNQLFSADDIFDEVYLLGWSWPIALPFLADGGPSQTNPPMVPELYAALAAARFFAKPTISGQRFFKIGTRRAAEVDWSDLPPVSQGDGEGVNPARERVRSAMSQLLSFSFAFRRVYCPVLVKGRWRGCRSEQWFQRQILNASVDLEDETVQGTLGELDNYAEAHMKWAAAMAAIGAGAKDEKGDASQPLYDFQHFARNDSQGSGKPSQIRLHDEQRLDGARIEPVDRPRMLDRTQREGFRKLLTSGTGVGLDEVLHYLTYEPLKPGHGKLGRFVGELHASCRRSAPVSD